MVLMVEMLMDVLVVYTRDPSCFVQTVDTAGWVVECTLLPSLLLFVFLFALFAAEIDDPFDMDSSVSVSIETLRVLRVAMKDWADNETKAQAQVIHLNH
eukprot:1393107-Amorphochlora_amoeboformis.AAC.1